MSKSSVPARSSGGASTLTLPLAEQLYSVIKDYDVCLLVAQLYIQMRTSDATEECREFYMSRIWEEKPGLPGIRVHGSLGALANQVHLWNPSYIERREKMAGDRNSWPRRFRPAPNTLKSKINRSYLVYLTSERGIRSIPTYRSTASAWSIKNLDKEIITLKEKLDDIKLIPSHIFRGDGFQHQVFHRLLNERNL